MSMAKIQACFRDSSYRTGENFSVLALCHVSHLLVVNSLILGVNMDDFAPDKKHILGTVVYFISMKVGNDIHMCWN